MLKSKLAEIESQHSNACSNLENSITELKHALECAQNEKDEFENKVWPFSYILLTLFSGNFDNSLLQGMGLLYMVYFNVAKSDRLNLT